MSASSYSYSSSSASPPLKKRSHVLLRLAAPVVPHTGKLLNASFDTSVKVRFLPELDQALLSPHRLRAIVDDGLGRQFNSSGIHVLSSVVNMVNQAPVRRGLCVDPLREIDHFFRPLPADDVRQQPCLHHGRDAQSHFRHAECRYLGGVPEITGCCELDAGTQRQAVDTRDRQDRHVSKSLASVVHSRDESTGVCGRPYGTHLADIGPAAERGSRSRTGGGLAAEHNDTQSVPRGELA